MTNPQDTSSEAWRHHCEALTVVAMPTREARQAHLAAVEKHRGQQARERLEQSARAMWEARYREAVTER